MPNNVSTLTQKDFKRSGSGFSFTGKLAEFVRNSNWIDGFEAVRNNESSRRNGYSSLWECISAGAEDTGNELYVAVRNYVDNIGNIDTCGIDALKNYANELSIVDDVVDLNFEFPLEIKKLVEIFSVNTAYLFNKETNGDTDTLATENTILHYTTIEKILDSLTDRDKYMSLMRDTFYNTLMKFLELNVSDVGGRLSNIEPTDKIWKLNVNRMSDGLWDDDIISESDIYILKSKLGVDKSFTEKIYADDIVAGKRRLCDFTTNEQSVIKAEMLSRETRYGSDSTLRYYYMRLYKVLEYFRFTTIAYRNAYELSEYDISTSKFVISDKTSDSDSILKFRNGEFSIDTSLVMRVAEWLADYSIELSNTRTRMKRKCQKNMMNGTKKVIVDLIREYLLEKIDSDTWKNIRDTTLFKSKLNKNFEVSVVEYIDPTEYFNIYNDNDIVEPEDYGMSHRYWESNYDNSGILRNDGILDFYNKLTDTHDTFAVNSASSFVDAPNLRDFLCDVFAMGAASESVNASNVNGIVYDAVESTSVTASQTIESTDSDDGPLRKYIGDATIGAEPYLNVKNTYHPSYQTHPFIHAFEEYSHAYTGILNLINSFSVDIEESRRRLDQRIDELGNTINFWLNWNEDFTGYSSYYEKSGDDSNSKFYQDSPFNFDALAEYINSDAFVAMVLSKTNPYYIDERTGEFILTDEEANMEAMRLRKYRNSVAMLKNREIYRYGKDNYGNIYILYKDAGNRNNKNALGDMWVRLKNRPIAFPMFEFNRTQNSFGKLSLIQNSDNGKLVSLISNALVKYNSEYGYDSSSKVVDNGISVSLAKNVRSGLLTSDGSGGYQELEPPSTRYEYTPDGMSYTLVKKNVATLTEGEDYFYYVDTKTGEPIEDGVTIYDKNGDTSLSERRPIDAVDDTIFRAKFANGVGNIYSNGYKLSFVSYSMSADNDPDTYFYYISNGVKNAVSKHVIRINEEASELDNFEKFSGTYASNGDFTVENIGSESTVEHVNVSLSSTGVIQTVDGTRIYEDFHTYHASAYEVDGTYGYSSEEIERVNSALSGGSEIDGSIRRVGGSNAVFSENLYDESGMEYPRWRKSTKYVVGSKVSKYDSEKDATYAFTCKTANEDEEFDESKWNNDGIHDERDDYARIAVGVAPYMLKARDGAVNRSFSLSSDAYYRPNPSEYSLCEQEFELSSLTFVSVSGYSDTIRPFNNFTNTNVYYPYTSITKVVTSADDPLLTTDSLSASPLQTVLINGFKCYYKVLADESTSPKVSGYDIDSTVVSSCVTTNLYKLHGGVSLYESAVDESPILLTFSDADGVSNVMKYSSQFSSSSQKKFNDFGFSHGQNEIYLTYGDSIDGKYVNSGTIFGKIIENVSNGVTDRMSFMRNNNRNLEYTSTSYRDKAFHIGEAVSKDCMFSVYGCVIDDGDKRALNVLIYTFRGDDVRTSEYRSTLKYELHDFSSDSSPEYGFKCAVTDDRLYVAFTCDVPRGDELLSNTINGVSNGTVGTSTFATISGYCGDSMITILSFDITDAAEITLEEDETRYIMENGALGYFPQYSGLIGKNIIFNNSQLTNDIRYPFYAQFAEFGTSSDNDELVHTITVNGDADYGDFEIERFIDTYDSFDSGDDNGHIRGFAIEKSTHPRAFYVDIDTKNNSGFFSLTGSTVGVRDVSRGDSLSAANNVVHIKATAENNKSYVNAFICSGDCTSVYDARELLYTDISRSVRSDFAEFFDLHGDMYAFHADRRTVSRLAVESAAENVIVSSVGRYYNRSAATALTSVSGYYGEKENIEGNCNCISKSTDGTTYILHHFDTANSMVRSYELTAGGNIVYSSVFAVSVDVSGFDIPCAVAFSNAASVIDIYQFDNDVCSSAMYRFSDDVITPQLSNLTLNGFASTDYSGNLVFTTSNSPSSISVSISNSLSSVSVNDVHINGSVYSKATTSTAVASYASNCGNYVLFSVNADGRGNLMYVDANIAYSGSIAEHCKILSVDGEEESQLPSSVGRCFSVDGIIAVDCDDNGGVLVSTNGGLTFQRQIDAQGRGVKIIGVGKDRFFGKDVNSGALLYSTDGNMWICDGTVLPHDWDVVSDSKETYFLCRELHGEGYDLKHRVRICSQTTVASEYDYDSMCVSDDGDVVMYGGLDGNSPLRYARSQHVDGYPTDGEKSNRTYQTSVFNSIRGKEYSSAYLFGKNMFFSPRYSSTVCRIDNMLDFEKDPSASYVDVSNALVNSAISFDGFTVVNDTLLMYPSDGSIILAYSDSANQFFNYYTDRGSMKFGDADAIGTSPSNEILFTPSESDGSRMMFTCTKFHNRNDFGLVELDNGYPIMVKYESITDSDGSELYQFIFSFMNDVNRGQVKIVTSPKNYPGGFDAFAATNPDRVKSSGTYMCGGEAIVYTFTTVDETTKYCIYRNTIGLDTIPQYDAFSITYDLNRTRRNNPTVTYTTAPDINCGYVSVLEGFTDFDPSKASEFDNITVLESGTNKSATVTSFNNYSYSDTSVFSGEYEYLTPYENVRRYVLDSNFRFCSVSTQFKTASGMFRDCPNASFGSTLVLSTTTNQLNISSTKDMFRGCTNALIPSANINSTSITNSIGMFYGCANAKLKGVTIPPNSTDATDMFNGCSRAKFSDFRTIPDSVIGMSGMFNMCVKGTFDNFTFGNMTFVQPGV